MVQHGLVVPNLLFQRLNPKIEPFYGHLHVPTAVSRWPELADGTPRRVSVNSFGKSSRVCGADIYDVYIRTFGYPANHVLAWAWVRAPRPAADSTALLLRTAPTYLHVY